MSPARAPAAGGSGALALYLALVITQRTHELWLSARHQRQLRARGAIEHGAGHFPLLIALHVALPIAITIEVLPGGARPPEWWPLALAAVIGAEGLRLWSMAALGQFWTARVLTVPGTVRIRRGPYRFFAHPSYAAATIELLAGPLMFGAWRTALALSVLNAVAIGVRVRCENRALAGASR